MIWIGKIIIRSLVRCLLSGVNTNGVEVFVARRPTEHTTQPSDRKKWRSICRTEQNIDRLTAEVFFFWTFVSEVSSSNYVISRVNIFSFIQLLLIPFTCRPVLGPTSLLYNVYRVITGCKATGVRRYLPTPTSAELQERVELYIYSPSLPTWQVVV
jgi:hypothetical protein